MMRGYSAPRGSRFESKTFAKSCKQTMNRLLALIWILASGVTALAQDITTLEKIGPVTSLVKSDQSVTLNCQDNSQVVITIYAPDLIRVRASFTKPVPATNHSWAIARVGWPKPRWNVSETPDFITLSTDEIEVVVRRSPLLIEFRDARTHRVLNSD